MMRSLLLALCISALPTCAQANVYISEIMYDPATPESSNEWMELCNNGNEPHDIAQWYVVDNDTRKNFTLVAGGSILAPNSCVIIARSEIALPTYEGMLFTSTFSLSNSGETIILKDNADVTIDTVSFDPSQGGKESDGHSLQKEDGVWVSRIPTPGAVLGSVSSNTTTTNATSTSSGSNANTSKQTVFTYEFLSVEPPQDVHVRVEGVFDVLRDSNARFVAEVYNARGIAESASAIVWNFGDGTTAEGKEVTHRYAHDGTYALSVQAKVGTLQDSVVHTVTVHTPNLELSVLPEQKGVRLTNKSHIAADVSGWRIVSGGSYFVIPNNTIITSQGSTVFDATVIKLYQLALAQQVLLYTPHGTLFVHNAAEAEVAQKTAVHEGSEEVVVSETETTKQKNIQPQAQIAAAGLVGTRVLPRIATAQTTSMPVVVQPTIDSEQQITEKPETELVINPSTQVAAVAMNGILPDGALWWATISALALVGVAGVFVARSSVSDADEFSIQESS